MNNIRNFCILAHIDHGKSTLADRFLELTGTIEKRKMREQVLDMHPLEREKGITIKMQPVRMEWNGYILNLIDTPGHVDFTYEVSRALAAVEGAILLVDATQGVQAQTMANLALAEREGLLIIPVINKIDLPSAEIERAEAEIRELFGERADKIFRISAKTGEGVEELLKAIVEIVPPPNRREAPDMSEYRNVEVSGEPLRALIFDSFYDPYQGVVAHVRIFSGSLRTNERLKFMAAGAAADALEVGVFSPERQPRKNLENGEIGYVATGSKEPEAVRVGDTITRNIDISKYHDIRPLAGYREPAPMVYASLFPENQDDFFSLGDALKKLKLNDASLSFEPEESGALGRGYRTGFLGMLHMEIISERLKREYGLSLIFSNPSVAFRAVRKGGGVEMVYAASRLPPPSELEQIEEPRVRAEIITPSRFLGAFTTLIHEAGGEAAETVSLGGERVRIIFDAPLRTIITDFYDRLKSVSQGFASMSYEPSGYRAADLVRLDMLVAGDPVPALSEIVPREEAYEAGRAKTEKLRNLIPRQLFEVAIQAAVDGRVVARSTLSALKKDVTGYLYGGDRTRKMKLWKKQQRGKKRLKETARVDIPSSVFLNMLKK